MSFRKFKSKLFKILQWIPIICVRIAVSLYFKECQVIGVENIPKNKPIIYVLNHSNQFVDSFFIALKSPHPVSYLMAAVSYNQGAVGFLSKLFETIPVERPCDNAIDGLGKIEPQTPEIVKGHGTQFTKQARAGDTLLIKGFLEYTIAEIKSDTEMIIKSKSKDTCELEGLMDYKIAPKINQASIFRNVTDALKDERCIVIFPEGCAHDRTDLLPLKAGVSIIGLETMAKYKDLDLSLVCCGLKYSHPSRFRSKVTIEFGTPFKIDSKHIEEYEKDKSTARNKFLGVVESKLREVIFTAPSYKELTSIYLAKRLFLPTPMNSNFSNEEINDIYKKFFDLYNSHKEEQDIKELFDDVYEYGRELKSIGIRDSQLYQPNFKFTHLQYLSIKCALNLILLIICLLPGLTMMAPLGFYSRAKAERVRLLKKGISSVGAETVSSTRILTCFVNIPIFIIGYWILVFLLQIIYLEITLSNVAYNCLYFIGVFIPYCYFCLITTDKIVENFINLRFCVYGMFCQNKMKELTQKRANLSKNVFRCVQKYASKEFEGLCLMKHLKPLTGDI